jgi:hypothetical protein
MTTLSTRPDHAAANLPGLPRLIGHQFRYDLRRYLRNAQGMVSTIIMPVMFLVIFGSVYRNSLAQVPGGTMKISAWLVPAIVAYPSTPSPTPCWPSTTRTRPAPGCVGSIWQSSPPGAQRA